jgi:hypothetical protein
MRVSRWAHFKFAAKMAQVLSVYRQAKMLVV